LLLLHFKIFHFFLLLITSIFNLFLLNTNTTQNYAIMKFISFSSESLIFLRFTQYSKKEKSERRRRRRHELKQDIWNFAQNHTKQQPISSSRGASLTQTQQTDRLLLYRETCDDRCDLWDFILCCVLFFVATLACLLQLYTHFNSNNLLDTRRLFVHSSLSHSIFFC
jgi:hypothetical protein